MLLHQLLKALELLKKLFSDIMNGFGGMGGMLDVIFTVSSKKKLQSVI